MHKSVPAPDIVRIALVLAIAAVVFRRALLRVALAVLAVVALVLLGSGAVVLAEGMHL